MKVGVSTATFFSKLLTEDSFSVIQRCGGETAEVFLTTFSEYEPEFGDILKERLNGLDIYSVHSLNTEFEPQLFNTAYRTRNDAEIIFKKVLEVGRKIGARYYTFHGSTRLKKSTVIDTAAIGKRMRELGDTALGYGIELCFENVHWAAFDSPEFFREVKEYAPNIGAVLDIKQAWQSGYDWRDYLSVMGDRIRNVHISDVSDGRIKMAGKGDFPFKELVARLKAQNYDGPLILEQYPKDYDSFDEIAESVNYMKKIIGGAYADQI